MRRSLRPALAALAISIAAAACKSPPDQPEKQPPPPPPRPAAAGSSASSTSSAAGAESAAPTLSLAPGEKPPSPLAGTWKGTYEAKKGSVGLPDKVKDKSHSGDDGKTMTGAGKMEIVISASGEVRGTASGALGDARLTGTVDADGAWVRATWLPEDPTAVNAMTGVMIGSVKDGVIHAEIRVAGPDAMMVRESKLDLKR